MIETNFGKNLTGSLGVYIPLFVLCNFLSSHLKFQDIYEIYLWLWEMLYLFYQTIRCSVCERWQGACSRCLWEEKRGTQIPILLTKREWGWLHTTKMPVWEAKIFRKYPEVHTCTWKMYSQFWLEGNFKNVAEGTIFWNAQLISCAVTQWMKAFTLVAPFTNGLQLFKSYPIDRSPYLAKATIYCFLAAFKQLNYASKISRE